MSLGVTRLGHIGLQVTDLDASIEWYRKVVGLKVQLGPLPGRKADLICSSGAFPLVTQGYH